jgi:release factor glutamine methyltransferase
MTAKELYRQGLQMLEEADTEDAGFDCLQLFAHSVGMDRTALLCHGDDAVTEQQQEEFLSLINRRATGEPLQYILGQWEFYSLPFQVGSGVLIPRADTEILVDEALRLLETGANPKVADLCAGSGCIAVTIAKNCPNATVIAVELSEDAIPYCKQNIESNKADNVTLIKGDVLAGPEGITELDLIVSNPPYIPKEDLQTLAKEVQQEPMMALDGGQDGLDFYRAIVEKWTPALKTDGAIAFEVGIHQAQEVSKLLEEQFEQVYIVPDLNDIPRVVMGTNKIVKH